MRDWINRVFYLEEINGGERCPTYLYRWTIARFGAYRIYLHRFVADDWSLDLHDHPKRFISIGLWGRYRESTPIWRGWSPETRWQAGCIDRVYRAPWIRTFSADHIHRISMVEGGHCWTLVITLKATRQWGFWHFGRFIPWRHYVNSDMADHRKACD